MSSPNLSAENVRKSQEISIDFEKVAVKAVQSFIIGSFYGFYAGSRSLNLPENLLAPPKLQVETAISGSLKGGVLFAVCGGVLFGSAEVLSSFRGKQDNLNYVAGGTLAGFAGTLVSQSYSIKDVAKKCIGLTFVGVTYAHMRAQLIDFERYQTDNGSEKSVNEKIVQLFTPPFVYKYVIELAKKNKK